MGSKTPPPGLSQQAKPREDDAIGSPQQGDLIAKTTPLQRIADALQVPPTVLYQPLNAIGATSEAVEQTDGFGEHAQQCHALIQAFMRISDPEERRRVLELVQASAEQS